MEDLAADFIIENNQPLELDAEISEPEHFDCVFELNAAGTTWGSISGTLSNQTDLQAALDLKADKSEVESVTGALADSIQAVDNKYDSITSGLDDSITAIDNKYDSITGALDDKIDSINGALGDDIDALESITSGLSDSISAIGSTIGGYGDIVNYNAADFATSIQGGKADTALQPNDNISELYNDVGYITSASLPTVNDGELTIKVNGSSIATFTANQGTDTIADITVPNSAAWGNITGTLSDQTDLQNALDAKVTNNATGTNALAIGNTSQSTAEGGVAVGYGARANSTYATAVGEDTRANNTNTTVIGRAAKATEARAIAIGSGAEANAQDAIAIKGINNTANTFQVYTYNMLDMSTGLIPDARISSNIARTVDIPTFDTNQMAAINSGANTTNIGQIATNTQDISDEITNRQNADNGLQSQIDALVVASDVFDIVGTYAELQAYDISTVPVNDIIKVLVDSTHNDAATYYRCTESGGVKSWTYIGSEGAYYTKGEADSKFALQTTTVNSHALSSNITLTASDIGALPDSTVIPTVNNSSITFQKNGTDFDTITLNQSSNDTINITVPTDTNDLTNGAGYITGINSTDVINALGYTPYSNANPDGYITSAALADYVTTNTAQTISAKKTFTGEKAILFKQTSNSDKLGFTLYNSSNTELGAFEYRPNTISGNALLNVNTSYSNSCYVGFRYWGTAVNVIAPKPSTAGDYYIPINITDGNTTVTAANTGTVNISSLLPTSDIFIAQYGVTSYTDITTAINNEKLVLCTYNGSTYYYFSSGGGHVLFAMNTVGTNYTITVDSYNNWTNDSQALPVKTSDLINDSGYITGITSSDVTTALGYTPADNTLSNVSTIDGGSAVQTALDGKVNKSGDTMTGQLQLDTDDNTSVPLRINNVSTTQRDITFNATNHRVATIRCAVNSSNQCQLLLGVNNTNDDAPNGIRIVRDTSGTAYIDQFPQCNAVDGQWVAINLDLISTPTSVNGSSALGAYTISSIPNDGYSYEVLLNGTLRIPTGNNFARLAVYSSKITSSIFICQWQNRTSGDVDISASCIIPVTSNRNIWVVRSTSWNGTVQLLRAVGYRRIGTNT